MEKPSIRERAGNHPVPLRNAIQALSRRWAYMGDADVEFLAPPESLRVSGAEVRQALGRRLRALQGKDLDIPSRN